MNKRDIFGENNPNYGNTFSHSEEFKRRQSLRMKKRFSKNGDVLSKNLCTKGKKLNLSEEQRKTLSQRMKKINESGFINRGGKCKFYKIDGFTIQGRYELYYYLKYLRGTKCSES